jgi:hypothetical protein
MSCIGCHVLRGAVHHFQGRASLRNSAAAGQAVSGKSFCFFFQKEVLD